ncbi:MAG: IS256 family transposase [Candidatus Azobacteroides sp.]|nr:IS256 family transposase [Candidatus Azobacteroides sp.]
MEEFNYKAFQAKMLEQLKSGKLSSDKNEAPAPLLENILNAVWEDKTDICINEDESEPGGQAGGYILKQVLDEGAADRIIDLYALGNSTREINEWMTTNMGKRVSAKAIDLITDCVLPEMQSWRNRSLDSVYPIVWVDTIHCKMMDEKNRLSTQTIYNVLTIDSNGHKDLAGMYISETEGVDFWLTVLTDLKARGVSDILIACTDNLTGFSNAVESVFPETVVQNSIVHQIRNSQKYVASKNRKELLKDLKLVYQAKTMEKAEKELDLLELKWGESYPIVIKAWRDSCHKLSVYFQYPEAIRRIMYTTNTVESYHKQIRKIVKNKGVFTNNIALEKLVYLAYRNIRKKWTMPLLNWGQTAQQLAVNFPGRFNPFV